MTNSLVCFVFCLKVFRFVVSKLKSSIKFNNFGDNWNLCPVFPRIFQLILNNKVGFLSYSRNLMKLSLAEDNDWTVVQLNRISGSKWQQFPQSNSCPRFKFQPKPWAFDLKIIINDDFKPQIIHKILQILQRKPISIWEK